MSKRFDGQLEPKFNPFREGNLAEILEATALAWARMMAFVNGHYSRGLPACGMLSYVMDGKSEKALGGLKKCIEGRCKTLRLVKSSGFAKSILSEAIARGVTGTHLAETQHDLGRR